MKFRNLEQLSTGKSGNTMNLAVPLPRTPDGRVYRYSPNEQAHPRHFVLGDYNADHVASEVSRKRMKLSPRSKQTVCPYSGVVGDDREFLHPDDAKAALATVKHAAFSDVEAEFSRIIEGFNRKMGSNSLLKITAKVEKKYRPKPRFSRRDLMRELVCEHCSRDYGVYAIALFCPDCGAPNLRLHFAREGVLVGSQVDLADSLAAEQEELAYRLLGNAHEDVLTAFEATLKAVYLHGMTQSGQTPKPVKNDFQNMEYAQRRFQEIQLDPFADLSDAELEALRLNIQKRHIIGHNLGVVDDKFAVHAQDAQVGQTVHLVGADIREFAAICQKVIDRLDDWLAGQASQGVHQGRALPPPQKTQSEPTDPLDKLDTSLSKLARRAGLWMAQNCGDEWDSFIDSEVFAQAFSESQLRDIQDALAELEAEGMIACSHTLSDLPRVRPQVELFAMFDPLAHGHDPVADAAELAHKALEENEAVDVGELHAATGWPLRRFNPAIAIVISHVGEGRVSGETYSEYPSRHFHLIAQDRVALKQFIARLKQ
ncbi:hypothetical protein GPL17_35970 [Bradyrhizobium yuanmingense]|uniref:hypothetical protein n=1 Tax=Bradyrhizobium yuanmingense TaxID=108015 RepID=UPI0012F9FD8A|nr:hypothetical protein [Bradyrhizobium yuanmingense]MVT55797.1 hypothetical protein [Bradyrhizobium yuanmingense]